MNNHRFIVAGVALALTCASAIAVAAEPPSVEAFLKRPTFFDMKISPDGRHLATTVPLDDDKTVLAVLDRVNMKPSAVLQMRGHEHVDDFIWVNDTRLVVSATKKDGMLDQPVPTGELFGVDADGKRTKTLFSYRAGGDTGSRISKPTTEYATAMLIDTLPDSDEDVLISVTPWMAREGGFSEARRMNINTGATRPVTRSPKPRAWLTADRQGNVRLSTSITTDGVQEVHVRPVSGGDWRPLAPGQVITPIQFDTDGTHLLVHREEAAGPDGVYRLNVDTGEQTLVMRSDVVDPSRPLYGVRHGHVVAMQVDNGMPDVAIIDKEAREARLATAVRNAFPGQFAYITSYTRDGKIGLVHVYSDRNSGEFYLLQLDGMKAEFLAASREWLDPALMSETRPIALKARDGTPLHGYLTLPRGRDAKDLPLVVNPHGGPHGIRDYWGFNEEVQLLASRGYAVLQVNFRGSGGYGRAFEHAGYREWGGKMQDDIADSVRWTIAEGLVDAKRICIYGASYGGYSALMNAARYPDLYQCTIGYVGVYDLNLMFNEGDISQTMFGRSYLTRVVGNAGLSAASPVNHADRITMPVMLIHGGEDLRVPQTHADRMRAALRKAGNDPVWLVERREGHGFYNMDNRVKLYTQLLAFLDEHIGAAGKAGVADGP